MKNYRLIVVPLPELKWLGKNKKYFFAGYPTFA